MNVPIARRYPLLLTVKPRPRPRAGITGSIQRHARPHSSNRRCLTRRPRVRAVDGVDDDGDGDGAGVAAADRERAAQALHDAFARLAPQGSDAWNFLGAFTLLGDRYGPYHPGASALSDALDEERRSSGRRGGRLERLRRERGPRPTESVKTELEEAMGHVVEAFRFLSARVATLEARLAAQDRPVEGPAWLVPARDVGPWAGPVTAHVTATTPGGDIVHADCGEGSLLDAFASRGTTAHGVEPRGALALRALERGCTVTIAEASEYLRAQADADLGGIVLSGVVDRLALHDLLPLLSACRRTLARGAPLIVLSEPVTAAGSREAPARDLVEGRSLHEATWELLLDRIGFVDVVPLLGAEEENQRIALAASTPP